MAILLVPEVWIISGWSKNWSRIQGLLKTIMVMFTDGGRILPKKKKKQMVFSDYGTEVRDMNWQCWDFWAVIILSEMLGRCMFWFLYLMFCHLLWCFSFWKVSFPCSSAESIKFLCVSAFHMLKLTTYRDMDAHKRVILYSWKSWMFETYRNTMFLFAILQLTQEKNHAGTPSSIWRWSTGAIIFQMPGRGAKMILVSRHGKIVFNTSHVRFLKWGPG